MTDQELGMKIFEAVQACRSPFTGEFTLTDLGRLAREVFDELMSPPGVITSIDYSAIAVDLWDSDSHITAVTDKYPGGLTVIRIDPEE